MTEQHTYKELSDRIKSLETTIHQRQNADNRYATSGRMQEDQSYLSQLKQNREEVKIVLDPNDTETILSTIKEIADYAEMAHDFGCDECGVFFNTDKKKGLAWWMAEVLDECLKKTHTRTIASALNNLQVAYEAVQAVGLNWTIDHIQDVYHVTCDGYRFTAKTPPIAMMIVLLDYHLSENKPVFNDMKAPKSDFVGLPGLPAG